jgi:heme exporter protein C
MRERIAAAAGLAGLALLVRNLYVIFGTLPDEAAQGAIYRILFIHAPAAIAGGLAVFAALIASILYLTRRDLNYDAAAASLTEVGLVFGLVNIATGMIWARIIWGIWWTWDPRLTSMFISCLLYASYLILRQAIDERSQRARLSAVLNIFSFPAVVITWKSIEWWRTQHPAPVLSFRTGGERRMDPAMESALLWNMLAFLLIAAVMAFVRTRQEERRREIETLRRSAHAF